MGKNKERPGVMVYFHLMEPLSAMEDDQFGRMIRSLMEYAQYGIIPQFDDPAMTIAWGYLRHAADVDKERYAERCARAKEAIAKRWGKDTGVYDRIPNTETDTDPSAEANKKATADAQTQASAVAGTQTTGKAGAAPPPVLMEPVATPPRMANSPSWAKMRQASVLRREGEDHEAWRQAQMEAFTAENERLRQAIRMKRQAEEVS